MDAGFDGLGVLMMESSVSELLESVLVDSVGGSDSLRATKADDAIFEDVVELVWYRSVSNRYYGFEWERCSARTKELRPYRDCLTLSKAVKKKLSSGEKQVQYSQCKRQEVHESVQANKKKTTETRKTKLEKTALKMR